MTVVVAGGGAESPFGSAVAERCASLGAGVERFELDPFGEEPPAGEGDVLVWDGAGAFAGRGGVSGVRAALDGAWLAIRPFARAARGGEGDGGKVLLIAPSPGSADAEAARAGLENLARTLSIEWARFGVRLTAVHPGPETAAGDVAELVAFLASPAGEYYSGCLFTLGAADPANSGK